MSRVRFRRRSREFFACTLRKFITLHSPCDFCIQPFWSVPIQQPVSASTWCSFSNKRYNSLSFLMQGAYFAPSWIKASCMGWRKVYVNDTVKSSREGLYWSRNMNWIEQPVIKKWTSVVAISVWPKERGVCRGYWRHSKYDMLFDNFLHF